MRCVKGKKVGTEENMMVLLLLLLISAMDPKEDAARTPSSNYKTDHNDSSPKTVRVK